MNEGEARRLERGTRKARGTGRGGGTKRTWGKREPDKQERRSGQLEHAERGKPQTEGAGKGELGKVIGSHKFWAGDTLGQRRTEYGWLNPHSHPSKPFIYPCEGCPFSPSNPKSLTRRSSVRVQHKQQFSVHSPLGLLWISSISSSMDPTSCGSKSCS